jgi:hypothetical protein
MAEEFDSNDTVTKKKKNEVNYQSMISMTKLEWQVSIS